MFTIGPSTLPNAGQGLFAAIDIEAGIRLGEYTGKILSPEQYKRLTNRDYVFQVTLWKKNKTIYIDAKHEKKCLMRKINAAKTHRQHALVNCYTYQYNSRIFFKTSRQIKKGEELICTYGNTYWT